LLVQLIHILKSFYIEIPTYIVDLLLVKNNFH
jgi:hypothetical protein